MTTRRHKSGRLSRRDARAPTQKRCIKCRVRLTPEETAYLASNPYELTPDGALRVKAGAVCLKCSDETHRLDPPDETR